MSILRILMIAPEAIPVPGGGSVEICMLSIARELSRDHDVTILSRRSSAYPAVSRYGRVTVERIPSGDRQTYLRSILAYLKDNLKKKKFDLIQVDNRPSYMAQVKKRFPGTPVTLFLHSLTFVPQTKAVAACLAKADLIIANSDSLKERLSHRFPASRSAIRTVHLGVDLDRFHPPDSKRKKQLKARLGLKDAYTILFAGRVIPRKGVPVLLKAAALLREKVPDVQLLIVGSGSSPYMKSLKAEASRLKLPVVFAGRISHRSIHRAYGAADCFVCPSQQHEAFGLVNVEAMATGIPVIASDIGGIGEIVKHKHNGYLIRKYTRPEEFARYLIRLARSRSLQAELSHNARKTAVRRFGWRQTAKALSALYGRFR